MKQYALYGAWLMSCIGTIGSLIASEIYGFNPCSLCWYQRIALFPLVWVLGVAAYHHFSHIVRYCIGLPIFGAFIALYQIYLINSDSTAGCATGCAISANSTILFWMPILSLMNFLLIISLLAWARKEKI